MPSWSTAIPTRLCWPARLRASPSQGTLSRHPLSTRHLWQGGSWWLEGEEEQGRTWVGQGSDSSALGELLIRVHALEASSRGRSGRCPIRPMPAPYVADHEAGAGVAPSAGRPDRTRTVSMPTASTPVREFPGVEAPAASEIERTTGGLGLSASSGPGSPVCSRAWQSHAAPGSEPTGMRRRICPSAGLLTGSWVRGQTCGGHRGSGGDVRLGKLGLVFLGVKGRPSTARCAHRHRASSSSAWGWCVAGGRSAANITRSCRRIRE